MPVELLVALATFGFVTADDPGRTTPTYSHPVQNLQLDCRYLAGRIHSPRAISLMMKFEISRTVFDWRGPALFQLSGVA